MTAEQAIAYAAILIYEEFPAMARTSTTRRAERKPRFVHPEKTSKALISYAVMNRWNRVVIPAASAPQAKRIARSHPVYGVYFQAEEPTAKKLR